jgi:hypothetical protein
MFCRNHIPYIISEFSFSLTDKKVVYGLLAYTIKNYTNESDEVWGLVISSLPNLEFESAPFRSLTECWVKTRDRTCFIKSTLQSLLLTGISDLLLSVSVNHGE